MKFQSLDIVRIAKEDIKQVGSTYEIPFELSATPPTQWKSIFEQQTGPEARHKLNGFFRYTTEGDARIEGKYIVTECGGSAEEIMSKCLPGLRKDVNDTNEKYEAYLQKQELNGARQRQIEEESRKKLKDLIDSLPEYPP